MKSRTIGHRVRGWGVAAACLLAGCSGPVDGPRAAGPEATAPGAGVRADEPAPERWVEVRRWVRESFPAVEQLGQDDLAAWLADPTREPPLLFDVRAQDEFAVSHLPGARRTEHESEALELLAGEPLDRAVVVYCSVGYRSSRLAAALGDRGYTRVLNLEGSIFAWANTGRRLEGAGWGEGQSGGAVHPYDADWGELLRRDLWSSGGSAVGTDRDEDGS